MKIIKQQTEENKMADEKVYITGVKAKAGGKQFLNPDTPVQTTKKEADYLISLGRAKIVDEPAAQENDFSKADPIYVDNDAAKPMALSPEAHKTIEANKQPNTADPTRAAQNRITTEQPNQEKAQVNADEETATAKEKKNITGPGTTKAE
jgi:hypothetical protein